MQPEILIFSSPISFWRAGLGKLLGNLLRDRDRAGIGQGAEIEARAADHVRDHVVVALGKLGSHQRIIDGAKIGQRHMRQNQVLLMGHAQLVDASTSPARSATTSICVSVASPGAPPTGFSDTVTEA